MATKNTDKPKAAPKKKAAAPKPQYVTTEVFDKFANQVLAILEGKNALDTPVVEQKGMQDPSNQKPTTDIRDADPNGFLPPQYQKIFEKYFDPADGFTARLMFPEVDEKGNETGGITFTIVVPLKFTNETDAYLKMYKQDLRTRALLPHNIAGGIDAYCKAVANNLHYNRQLKTK